MLDETIWKVSNYITEYLRQHGSFRISSSGIVLVVQSKYWDKTDLIPDLCSITF